MDSRQDAELVSAARNGEKGAFRELVERHQARVATTVIGMLGRCPEAEDVGQETFIRFYRALDSFRGDSSVSSFVTRIAINLSLNELKRRKRQGLVFQSDVDMNSDGIVDEHGVADPYENRQLVFRALQELPEDYRAVVVLRIIDGYSTLETAGLLELPIGTVTSRLARGQLKLKEIIRTLSGEAQ